MNPLRRLYTEQRQSPWLDDLTREQCFSGSRWEAVAARGAQLQRPLWSSTGRKDPAEPDTRYVDELIDPHTVTTLPPATLEAVDDHCTVARTVDRGVDAARQTVERLRELGIGLDEVGSDLERDGLTAFPAAYDQVIELLAAKARGLAHALDPAVPA